MVPCENALFCSISTLWLCYTNIQRTTQSITTRCRHSTPARQLAPLSWRSSGCRNTSQLAIAQATSHPNLAKSCESTITSTHQLRLPHETISPHLLPQWKAVLHSSCTPSPPHHQLHTTTLRSITILQPAITAMGVGVGGKSVPSHVTG
jgi:hypothetical protein